jgi:hypothetical protein
VEYFSCEVEQPEVESTLDSACSIFVVVRADQDIAPVSHPLQWMDNAKVTKGQGQAY